MPRLHPIIARTARDTRGTAMVEMAVIFPLLFLLTVAILEFGILTYQWVSAEKATEAGVRFAVTADIAAQNVTDCGVDPGTAIAGTPCRLLAGSTTWSIVCRSGSAGCDPAAFAAIVARMSAIFPRVTAANVAVEYSGTGLGFVGRGSPVPAVSVWLENMTFDFAVLDALAGLNQITLPPFRATLIGEDLNS